jgi:hypothetical protein
MSNSNSSFSSNRSFGSRIPAGADLFPSPRPKSIPDAEYLDELDICPKEFSKAHRPVMCPHCAAMGRKSFLMLFYAEQRPGYKRAFWGFRPIAKGNSLNSCGKKREMFLGAKEMSITCDEGHITRVNDDGTVTSKNRATGSVTSAL